MKKKSYLKFLDELSENNKKYNLSRFELLLLDVVATKTYNDKIVYVKDLIKLNQLASRASLHKALLSLIDKNLLELKITEEDGRLKEVYLTVLAEMRYEELSKAIELAAKEDIN